MDYYFDIKTEPHCPIRGFVLSADNQHLYGVKFILHEHPEITTKGKATLLHQIAQRQIESYLAGELKSFDLPLKTQGTVFQQRVWTEIAAIPFRETVTYGQVAVRLGDAHLARAVGQAANRNPLPVIIPCHRVVGSGGSLTGFAPGVATKAFLLSLEKKNVLW